jgi:hypothetical protein
MRKNYDAGRQAAHRQIPLFIEAVGVFFAPRVTRAFLGAAKRSR